MVGTKPIIEFAKAIREMHKGEVLEIIISDITCTNDLPIWSNKKNSEIIEIINLSDRITKFLIRKN